MRILLIIDNKKSAHHIEAALKDHGTRADIATDREDGLQLAKLFEYDLIVVDHEVGRRTAGECLRNLRANGITKPVIALVMSGNHRTVADLLDLGADDCIVAPYHPLELAARASAIVRRWKGDTSSIIQIGDVRVDTVDKIVTIDGEHVNFTKKEYEMFELLVLNRQKVVSPEMILSHLYSGHDEPTKKIVDVFLCKIRRKLAPSATTVITTKWGHGFIIECAHENEEALAA